MSVWIRLSLLPAAVLLALASQSVAAEQWSAELQRGGRVTVDPRTNRATIQKGGVQTQLWDGVHRLEDGSIITIHSGQVVPNEEILQARRRPRPEEAPSDEQWEGVPIVGFSPCERLVRRVCGDNQRCADYPACSLARQLLEMENSERETSGSPNYMTYSSGQCQKAERDRSYFSGCGQAPTAALQTPSPAYSSPSACQMLVDKVCGAEDACTETEACGVARQLLRMSQQADTQAQAALPQQSPEDYQCREALDDEDYFQRCGD